MGVKRQLESPKQNKSKSNATVISKRLRQAEVVDSEGELASVSGEKKTVQYPISISVDSGIALIYSTSRGGGRWDSDSWSKDLPWRRRFIWFCFLIFIFPLLGVWDLYLLLEWTSWGWDLYFRHTQGTQKRREKEYILSIAGDICIGIIVDGLNGQEHLQYWLNKIFALMHWKLKSWYSHKIRLQTKSIQDFQW